MRTSTAIAAALLVACPGCARSPDDWRAGLGARDPLERGLSALALARVAPAECADALPVLLQLVEGDDAALAAAAKAELERSAVHHVPFLLASFSGVADASPDFRSALRAALVAAGPVAVEPLREHLLDGGESNPKELGQILADIGKPAIGPVRADLADPDPVRRLCAAWILGRIGPDAAAAVPVLVDLAVDDEPRVANQAALALAEVAPLADSVRSVLERELGRREGDLAATLREALARLALNRAGLGDPLDCQARLFALGAEAFVPAVDACAAKNERLRAAGAAYLRLRYGALAFGLARGFPEPQSSARLRAQLEDANPRTLAWAAFQVAILGSQSASLVQPLADRTEEAHAGAALSAELALLHVVRRVALELARGRP